MRSSKPCNQSNNFTFHVIRFLLPSSNMHSSPSYGDYIQQLARCGHCLGHCFVYYFVLWFQSILQLDNTNITLSCQATMFFQSECLESQPDITFVTSNNDMLSSKPCNQSNNFIFHIISFLLFSSNMNSGPSYCDYIPQLVGCGHCSGHCFVYYFVMWF